MDRKRYLWDAEEYSRHSSEQFSWALDLIHKLNLEGTENILDLGCGDGKITALLAEHQSRGHVVGVDSSGEMVAQAVGTYGGSAGVGLDFLQMEVEALGFDQAFNVVFSNAMMHWVHNHPVVLRGIYRSLVPGGLCLLQMGGQGNAARMIDALNRVMDRSRWRDFFSGFQFPYQFYDVETYRDFLVGSGLVEVRVELIEKDMQHPDLDSLAGWMRSAWLPYTARVPQGLREVFIAEVSEQYARFYPPELDGTLHVPMVRLEVEARRF